MISLISKVPFLFRRWIGVAFLYLILFFVSNLAYSDSNTLLALSAMQIENDPVINLMTSKKSHRIDQVRYTEGMLSGYKVISTLTGIGEANAAIVTALLVSRFHPAAVIFTGVAGALQDNINYGDVVIATRVFSDSFGRYTSRGPRFPGLLAGPIRRMPAPLVYTPDKNLLMVAKSIKKPHDFQIHFGQVATTQHFPFDKAEDDKLRRDKVLAISMEDSGVMRACWLFQTPCLVIRAISDNIYKHQQYTHQKAKMAANNAAIVLAGLIRNMGTKMHRSM